MTRPLRIMTANIKGWRPMRQSRVRAVLQRLRDLAPTLLGTQEMWAARYRRALRNQLTKLGHSAPKGRAGTCVSWDPLRLRRRDSGQQLLHGTVRVRRTVVSWWRRIVWARFHPMPNGARLSFASVHFTPSAFSNRFRGADRTRVRRAWDHGAEQLREWIEQQLATGSTHVAVSMDANAKRRHVLAALCDRDAPGGWTIAGRRVLLFTSPSTDIDHVLLVGDWQAKPGAGKLLPVPYGDHPAFYVDAYPAVSGR